MENEEKKCNSSDSILDDWENNATKNPNVAISEKICEWKMSFTTYILTSRH